MKLPFGKKVKCIICDARVVKDKAAVIKYKYEMEKIGTAYICKLCAEDLEPAGDDDAESV